MRGRRWVPWLVVALLGAMAGAGGYRLRLAESIPSYTEEDRPARIYPDYQGLVIPPNLAPLNFRILEVGGKYCLRLTGSSGAQLEIFSRSGVIQIPPAHWRKLLEANRGAVLKAEICVKDKPGWRRFPMAHIRVAADEIDPYVVYRFMPPIYNKWDRISLVQRDLRSFEERTILDNARTVDPGGRTVGRACFNCHTFLNHRASTMVLHMRPAQKRQIPAMILVLNGQAESIDTRKGGGPAAYAAWHPTGSFLTYSRNSLVQLFHTAGAETREVIDRNSDLGLYRVGTGEIYSVPQVSRKDRLETFPTWSPDGRYLYFCSAPAWSDKPNAVLDYDKVRYDLVRVAYDPMTDRWGEVETVVSSSMLGRSISLPKISPDGRYLVFCGHEYGSFPIYQPGSDLYLLDLYALPRGKPLPQQPPVRRLAELNSPRSDSYHSWSSNSRWIIFSSKREDGVFTRLYLAHLEEGGRFSKPFVLPQEDPDSYGRCLMVYNRPELLREPVSVPAAEIARAINISVSQGLSADVPKPEDSPWQPLR